MINKAAIYHRSTDQYCYPLNTDEVQIRLQTGKEVTKVSIVSGDPFSFGILGGDYKWEGTEQVIDNKIELRDHSLWQVKINPEFKRIKYYFKVYAKNDIYFVLEQGIYTIREYEHLANPTTFNYAWLNENDVIDVPNWVSETIWYQIFPERFNKSIEKDVSHSWDQKGKVKNDWTFGGDLPGITTKLDYISKLGVNGLYMTPIFKANTTHKYDTIDYFEIDPAFGTKDDFKQLVDEAHSRGIRVMLDAVFNHTSTDFFAWQDVLVNKEKSKYADWFMIFDYNRLENQCTTKEKQFFSFAFTEEMPKLNTNNLEVQEYLINVMKYWITEYGIDGWRLDVANEVSHDFWRKARSELTLINPEVYILGEVWYDSISWLRGEQFHSVMNYPLTTALMQFINDSDTDANVLMYEVNRCYAIYPNQVNDGIFNLLDSHDTARLINQVNGDIDKAWQLLAILLTMQGSPCLYYGTEILLEGGHDPDCRRPMPWRKVNDNAEKIDMFKSIVKVRNQYPQVRGAGIKFEDVGDRIVKYVRGEIGSKVTIVVNQSTEEYDIGAINEVLVENKLTNTMLQPGGFIIYK